MNILTKNRIIEKGDEFRHADGRWMPIPDANIGLQIMFSKYTEVRRPGEEPVAKYHDKVTPEGHPEEMPEKPRAHPEEQAPENTAEALEAFVERGLKAQEAADTAASYLPTVISEKAHSRPAPEPAVIIPSIMRI